MSTHTTTVPSTTARPGPIRRLALLALGLAIVVSGLGLGSSPASAIAPGAPKHVLAAGYQKFIRVYITPSTWADPDAPITGYTVERFVQGQAFPNKTWQVANVAPIVDTSAVMGTTYAYRARANSSDGPSAWSNTTTAKRTVGVEEWDKFDTPDFVNRQYQDFLGRPPTPAERAYAVSNLDQGAWTSGSFINMLVGNATRTPRHQVIRLYRAYFDRNADHGGLDFWFDRIASGAKTINHVSNSFAASAEFQATYGNLTNGQFVTLAYANVLDRTPSPEDHAYWKGRLDSKAISRGRMMTLFSESVEFKGTTRGIVLAADVYDAMLDETSPDVEVANWGSHIQQGGNPGDYGTRLMLLNSY